MEFEERNFYCKQGVRQGDPLSPLLFVIAVDLLWISLNKAMWQWLISPPLNFNTALDFPIVQYADDTLVMMQADTRQLFYLKALLNTFADATGLKVNYNKSNLIPINMSEERAAIMINTLNCKRRSFPITYRGMPLILQKPNVEQCMPLVRKTTNKLMGLAEGNMR